MKINNLVKFIAERDCISPLQAEMLVNHCKYLVNKLLAEFRVDEASILVNEILGITAEEAGRLERGEI